jgi:hypothetical protein
MKTLRLEFWRPGRFYMCGREVLQSMTTGSRLPGLRFGLPD